MTKASLLSKLAKRFRPGAAKDSPRETLSPEEIRPYFTAAFKARDEWYWAYPESERHLLPKSIVSHNVMEAAAKSGDIDALIVYAKFPEVSYPSMAGIIPLLRVALNTTIVGDVITRKHVDAYKRVAELFSIQSLPRSEAVSNSERDTFSIYVLQDLDRSDVVLRIAEQRGITSIPDIEAILEGYDVAPAVGDGNL